MLPHFDGTISLGNILAGAAFLFALWRYHITTIKEQAKNTLEIVERFNRLETSLIERLARLETWVEMTKTFSHLHNKDSIDNKKD